MREARRAMPSSTPHHSAPNHFIFRCKLRTADALLKSAIASPRIEVELDRQRGAPAWRTDAGRRKGYGGGS